MILGQLRITDFLLRTAGQVRGRLVSDAKRRWYAADYQWEMDPEGNLSIFRTDGTGDRVQIQPVIDIDESLIAFFGLYSGDGAKGSEAPNELGKVKVQLSFSQREPFLVRFAVEQFRRLFPGAIHFVFSLGEDSAYFMDGAGLQSILEHYGGAVPQPPTLREARPDLNEADQRYLKERRPVPGTNEEHLAFYYSHKPAMESILTEVKQRDLQRAGIELGESDRVTASLRRPFKKGARQPGGSSRSDEVHVGGLNGCGEFFLKMLHEIEDSILHDAEVSTQGLVAWMGRPSEIGRRLDIREFFESHTYGQLGGERPQIAPFVSGLWLNGRWARSKETKLHPTLRINPLWCYTSGLYLAEGTTPKSALFQMFQSRPKGLALGFTSSENTSLALILRALGNLFPKERCLDAWKVKVGSQYFPELVVIGLKNGVPMLRGGNSGDGKLRTLEISLAIKEWALELADCLRPYADRFSHVEPTGAGVPRIDFWASSSLCKWYFPLIMYATFGNTIPDPTQFIVSAEEELSSARIHP
jgi:hypothetical protein